MLKKIRVKKFRFHFKANKIEPINNISWEKVEPGVKVENWVLVVHCGRDMEQKDI